MVSIYQEAINRAAAEAAEKAEAKVRAEMAEATAKAKAEAAEATDKAAKAGMEKLYSIALNLSKKYDRSFESALDDCTDSPSEKEICMEKYKKMIG